MNDPCVPGRGGPSEVPAGGEALRLEIALRPVSHDRHGALAVDDVLHRAVPAQRGVVGVHVPHERRRTGSGPASPRRPSHGVSPVHSPRYRSGPMVPRSTLSRRCTAAQIPLSPSASGRDARAGTAARRRPSARRGSWAASGEPRRRCLLLYQSTLERWMFTGTL